MSDYRFPWRGWLIGSLVAAVLAFGITLATGLDAGWAMALGITLGIIGSQVGMAVDS